MSVNIKTAMEAAMERVLSFKNQDIATDVQPKETEMSKSETETSISDTQAQVTELLDIVESKEPAYEMPWTFSEEELAAARVEIDWSKFGKKVVSEAPVLTVTKPATEAKEPPYEMPWTFSEEELANAHVEIDWSLFNKKEAVAA